MPAGAFPGVGAVIDIGSTSVHLLVAWVGADAGRPVGPLVDESDPIGLGERVDATGKVGEEATGALVTTIERYLAIAAAQGAEATAVVATEPLRNAADAGAVSEALERRFTQTLHVLTPDEEALCTLVGVTGGRRVTREVSVVDVGGGSTELVTAVPGRAPAAFGVPIGAIRLAALIVTGDPPTADELAELRATARAAFEGMPCSSPSTLVAVGGTATNLVRVAAKAGSGAALDSLLSLDKITWVEDRLARRTAEMIAAEAGIRPGRARILPAGAAILAAVIQRCGLSEVQVSEASLREGVVLLLAHAGAAWRQGLPELAAGWS